MGLGACLACFIRFSKTYEGQALQHTQELVVLVLRKSCINEL